MIIRLAFGIINLVRRFGYCLRSRYSISRIEGASVYVGTKPNETVSMKIGFSQPFASVPQVTATIVSTAPERFYPPCVSDVTTKGFTLYMHRTSDSSTRVNWIAVA